MIKLSRRPVIRWPGSKPRSAPIPPARDPFVNTPLLRLTPDADGADRFWISSFNAAFGALGVLVNEYGKCRLFPFGTFRYPGFYSAVQTDADTLWLCGNLANVIRLNLQTGKFDEYATGAPSALVFSGMVYDKRSDKLFAVAFPGTRRLTGIVFNTRTRRPVTVLDPIETLDHYMRSSIANADGTYSVQCQCPGLTYLRWDPRDDGLRIDHLADSLDLHGGGNRLYRTIQDDAGRAYLPGFGWYNGRNGKLERGPEAPGEPATWFMRDGDWVYGADPAGICRWHFKQATRHAIESTAGMSFQNTAMTASGRLVSVSRNGQFTRVVAATGELETSCFLPTDSVQPADCVIRIDQDRVLGTPFITQRFWETNLRTKQGLDCGAAAPGGGEILKVWNLNRAIYMAAYTGGELMRYDPSRPARFPENPHVVAKPPTGMRPVAATTDGRHIFYACSHHYGHLGSILTRYDTRTGRAMYKDDPLPDQMILHLAYDHASNSLLAGTTYDADCASVPPATQDVYLARIDAGTLEVTDRVRGPEGAGAVGIIGPLGRNRWLGTASFGKGLFDETAPVTGWFTLNGNALEQPDHAAIRRIDDWTGQIQYANRPGHFVLRVGSRIELWDMRRAQCIDCLADSLHLVHFFVQGRDLLTWSAWDVFVLENVL